MSYDELHLYAEMFYDVQEFRKAAASKVRSMTVTPAVVAGEALRHYERAEHELSLTMRRCLRETAHPYVLEWQKREKGIGEHLLARLLGAVGDPRTARPMHWEGSGKARILVADEPRERSVSQLWSYCGHGDATRKRRHGMTEAEAAALGNPRAKMVLWNIACACIKTDGHYREVYNKRRAATELRQHAAACVRCGPSGKPAEPGSPWSKAHQHADALRIVGKAVLRDLWLETPPDGEA
jgi:hypothetical protein